MLEMIEGRRRGRQDDMVGWHHQLNGQELGQTLGDGEGQHGEAWSAAVYGWKRVSPNLATEQNFR